MKRLLILCIVVGLFSYFFKDGEHAANNIKAAATQIASSLKGLF